jgi:hypothetical protein
MNFSTLFCAAYISILVVSPPQLLDPKEMPENKGSISEGNNYHNPALSMTITLPGEWHFFDRTAYSSAESKQREREMLERARATCKGALCEPVEIDVALQSPSGPPSLYAIFLTAHKLSAEYQNRERHPLKEFAEIMSINSLGDNWVPESNLIEIRLGGRPAYRLIMHHKRTTTAKGFLYVGDSNGQVFMLLGTALRRPEDLQSALEKINFATNAAP